MSESNITQLLHNWVAGDKASLDELTPLVYRQLHDIAARIFRSERSNHTLQATAVVNEAYTHLVDVEVEWEDRTHFYALAARLMRRILVDHAKARLAQKRGSGAAQLPLDDVIVVSPEIGEDVVNLHEALEELAGSDERKARILELHYFGGLTYEEMEQVLGVSTATLSRELRFAKAWLRARLAD